MTSLFEKAASTILDPPNFFRPLFSPAEQYDIVSKLPVRPKLCKPDSVPVEKPTHSAKQSREIIANIPAEQERLE